MFGDPKEHESKCFSKMASSYRAGLGKEATGSQVILIQFNPSAKLGLFQRSRMTSARTSVSQMLRASFLHILAAV